MSSRLSQAVILAGGLATRLHPVTQTIPKALIHIKGKSFIEHQLELLATQGIRDVVLCVGFLGEMIEQVVGDGSFFGMRVHYSYDGPMLLGTGGAIKQAQSLLHDNFFVVYGDSYLTCDYDAVRKAFFQTKQQGLMTVFCNEEKWDASNVEYAEGKILIYDKKQRTSRMRYIDYGLGILTQQALMNVPAASVYDLASLYQTLLQQDQLAAFEVKERFYEVGSFTGIEELEYHLGRGV